MSGIVIREAASADLPAVVGIVRSVLCEFEIPVEEPEVAAELGKVVAPAAGEENGQLWVLVDRGAVVGCAAVTPIRDGVCELKRMYLLPERRGQGLGRKALEHALSYARDQGFARMELETHTRMERAREMYRKAGFQKQCATMRNCGCDQSMYLDLQAPDPGEAIGTCGGAQ